MGRHLRSVPRLSLQPFIKTLWDIDERNARRPARAAYEHILPTGSMHLVFRLADEPLRLFDEAGGGQGCSIGHAIVGGARSGYYIKDASAASCSVGVMLWPGVVRLLFGGSAEELAQRHTPLEDLWGREAANIRERLLEAAGPAQRLLLLQDILESRLSLECRLHPAIACAIERFENLASVDEMVRYSGYSHRHFSALFRRAVGLTPKVYCRIRRFQKVLQPTTQNRNTALAITALEAGYSDQAHFSRDFLEFSGVTPAAYRALSPVSPNHLILPAHAQQR
jgi:AraC-like DNA-binding protein